MRKSRGSGTQDSWRKTCGPADKAGPQESQALTENCFNGARHLTPALR
jgi:hypothetical protein